MVKISHMVNETIDLLDSWLPTIKGQYPLPTSGKIWFGRLYQGDIDLITTFNKLKSMEVSVIWSLITTKTYIEEERASFKLIHTPIEDLGVPDDSSSFITDLKLVYKLLQAGSNIYIHCFGGRGRTGMAILALELLDGSISQSEAIEKVKRLVDGPENQTQIEFALTVK